MKHWQVRHSSLTEFLPHPIKLISMKDLLRFLDFTKALLRFFDFMKALLKLLISN